MLSRKEGGFSSLFPTNMRRLFENAGIAENDVCEIRMRVNCPLLIYGERSEYSVTDAGQKTTEIPKGHKVSATEIERTLEYISGYSLYAYEEEMKQGFLTIQGGHRIGVAGRIVMDGKRISCVRNIMFLNVRFAHEVTGCAAPMLPYLLQEGKIAHTLLISPPGCGKTTLLRDLIRSVSNGSGGCIGQTVGVVDERSELGGSWLGIPQNDLGIRTDILDCCPKAEGMMMLLRSMAPQVIAVDELGGSEDVQAIEQVFRCGCTLLATVHGNDLKDVLQKKEMEELFQRTSFSRYVLLQICKGGERRGTILDESGNLLFEGEY